MELRQAAGAETELVHLYDIDFKGCKSCFACKLKNSKCNGVCALRDDLRPILEFARGLLLQSPWTFTPKSVDFCSTVRGLLLICPWTFANKSVDFFPNLPQSPSGSRKADVISFCAKVIPSAMIFTMNCPEDYMKVIGYPPILEENTKVMQNIFGYAEKLYVCNTYQFNDYSRYDFNLFSEEEKRKHREPHYGIDLQNAYELGKRLVEKAKE